jgi:hypothetical protein
MDSFDSPYDFGVDLEVLIPAIIPLHGNFGNRDQ